jgi:hypothetical protein
MLELERRRSRATFAKVGAAAVTRNGLLHEITLPFGAAQNVRKTASAIGITESAS